MDKLNAPVGTPKASKTDDTYNDGISRGGRPDDLKSSPTPHVDSSSGDYITPRSSDPGKKEAPLDDLYHTDSLRVHNPSKQRRLYLILEIGGRCAK